jgi:hypothetical protein
MYGSLCIQYVSDNPPTITQPPSPGACAPQAAIQGAQHSQLHNGSLSTQCLRHCTCGTVYTFLHTHVVTHCLHLYATLPAPRHLPASLHACTRLLVSVEGSAGVTWTRTDMSKHAHTGMQMHVHLPQRLHSIASLRRSALRCRERPRRTPNTLSLYTAETPPPHTPT